MGKRITLRDEAVARLLVGKEVEVSVSEPFDFEYPGEGGLLRGRITAAYAVEGGEASDQRVIVELETPFVPEEGPLIRSLVARRRYGEAEGIVEMLACEEFASANLSYSHEVPEDEQLSGASPFLIGSVRLVLPDTVRDAGSWRVGSP